MIKAQTPYNSYYRSYKPEQQRGETIHPEAKLAGIARRRKEDILQAAKLEREVFGEVWDE